MPGTAQYQIVQSQENAPDILAFDLPKCPIPGAGVISTTISSNQDVHYFINYGDFDANLNWMYGPPLILLVLSLILLILKDIDS